MASPEKIDPRTRILETADQLFYAEGIRATGTEKIMTSANVAKATFYRHFESKDALVLAYLDHRDQGFWTFLAGPAPQADIRSVLATLDAYLNRPDVTGCPFLRIASEYPEPTHPFHQRVIAHKDKLLRYLIEKIPRGVRHPEAHARILLTLIDGALSMRLVYGPTHHVPLLAAADVVLTSLKP